ncbi:hypothetical protein Aab01nite_38870 [Paractinoplanes abujensis]|nr:hypothetical protein Aab01nite_38870 [Actinoplanes abujensis]
MLGADDEPTDPGAAVVVDPPHDEPDHLAAPDRRQRVPRVPVMAQAEVIADRIDELLLLPSQGEAGTVAPVLRRHRHQLNPVIDRHRAILPESRTRTPVIHSPRVVHRPRRARPKIAPAR